jgi:Major tropism determinant N-terminal domain
MPLRLRRGTNADRTTITPVQGEPIYTTDTKKLYVGDGTTAGGVEIGGGGTLTVNTQDFTASGTWTKPANALWVEVTMCGAGEAGEAGGTTSVGRGGKAGRTAMKTFIASDLASTVSVTCGTALTYDTYNSNGTSSFGTHLYALPAPIVYGGDTLTATMILQDTQDNGGIGDLNTYFGANGKGTINVDGAVGCAMGPGGGGAGGGAAQTAGGAGGKASSGEGGSDSYLAKRGGGGAGGASGTTGVAGTAGGYDTITGFGNGGGGGGEGTAGAGGAGGAAVRGGGGGGGGKGTTAGGAGGAGGAGFVRVRTLCFG